MFFRRFGLPDSHQAFCSGLDEQNCSQSASILEGRALVDWLTRAGRGVVFCAVIALMTEKTSATRGCNLVMVSLSCLNLLISAFAADSCLFFSLIIPISSSGVQDCSSLASPVSTWSWDSVAPASWVARADTVSVVGGVWGGGASAAGSRITGRVIPRADLSWGVREQQKLSSFRHSPHATLGHPGWVHAVAGRSVDELEHTQQ